MPTLTYLKRIPTEDLLLRVMGPDAFGAAYYVARVRHRDRDGAVITQAELIPVPPGWTCTEWRGGRGNRGAQEWIRPDAVEIGVDGVARLTRTDDRTA